VEFKLYMYVTNEYPSSMHLAYVALVPKAGLSSSVCYVNYKSLFLSSLWQSSGHIMLLTSGRNSGKAFFISYSLYSSSRSYELLPLFTSKSVCLFHV
jgi:hypothetical protein